MGWEDRDCFFNIILFVSVSCERLLLTSMKRKRELAALRCSSLDLPLLPFFLKQAKAAPCCSGCCKNLLDLSMRV